MTYQHATINVRKYLPVFHVRTCPCFLENTYKYKLVDLLFIKLAWSFFTYNAVEQS